MLVGVMTGSVTGAISGFFGVPAFPLTAIYLHNAVLAPRVIRANVLSAICCTLSIYLIVLSLHGVYDASIIIRAALLTPIFAAGVYCGKYLFRIAPVEWFKKATYAILICTALMMEDTQPPNRAGNTPRTVLTTSVRSVAGQYGRSFRPTGLRPTRCGRESPHSTKSWSDKIGQSDKNGILAIFSGP